MLDAKTTEKELLIMNILDILKRYVDPTRLSELNACLPEHPKKLRATDYADIIICAPIAFTEKGRLLECLSGHMAYNKESKLIQDLRRESYEDEKNNPKSTGFQQKESPESLRNSGLSRHWQGHKDSNSGHAVLETAALPTELYP